ncbi:putative jacalin-like lectin domain-containing protein [Helianthus annuus]|nr:putative jacalin-like lectin domain-containing protein [Helianthus annuus]
MKILLLCLTFMDFQVLQFPEEILIGVSGYFCPMVYRGFPVIQSLSFKSNRRTFGPFGMEKGTPFKFVTNGGHIVSFYGRSGWVLDSIEFHVSTHKPILFRRIQMMIKKFNHHSVDDEEQQKAKGSMGYSWGF